MMQNDDDEYPYDPDQLNEHARQVHDALSRKATRGEIAKAVIAWAVLLGTMLTCVGFLARVIG